MSIKPKKSLGQHFLIDSNISRKIVSLLDVKSGETVVEIGPGTGALTKWLVESYSGLIVIDVDPRVCSILNETYPNLNVVQADIRDYNWSELRSTVPLHIIGNIPYYITTPILFSLLDKRNFMYEAVLMIQKEVARRLVAVPSTKEYGILSVQLQLFASVELCFHVPRHVFRPQPRVDSSVVRLRFDKPEPACDVNLLRSVIRTAFNQRRKKLKNALKSFGLNNEKLTHAFNLNRRAEELNPSEFIVLTNLLADTGNMSNQ